MPNCVFILGEYISLNIKVGTMFKKILCALLVSNCALAQEYKEVPEKAKRTQENSFYGEILNRTPTVTKEDSRGTNAHENIHYINSEFTNLTVGRKHAFYVVGEKRVYYTPNPKLLKSDVINYVPSSLRGNRFDLYIKGSPGWNNISIYIMNEWVAYIGGGAVALEDYENKSHKDRSDRVAGALEFSIYSVALCMAIQEKDPNFWNEKQDFRNFVKKMLIKSYDLFQRGRFVKDFASPKQEELMESLQKSPDAEKIREFLKKWFDGVWLENKNFNFI